MTDEYGIRNRYCGGTGVKEPDELVGSCRCQVWLDGQGMICVGRAAEARPPASIPCVSANMERQSNCENL